MVFTAWLCGRLSLRREAGENLLLVAGGEKVACIRLQAAPMLMWTDLLQVDQLPDLSAIVLPQNTEKENNEY